MDSVKGDIMCFNVEYGIKELEKIDENLVWKDKWFLWPLVYLILWDQLQQHQQNYKF